MPLLNDSLRRYLIIIRTTNTKSDSLKKEDSSRFYLFLYFAFLLTVFMEGGASSVLGTKVLDCSRNIWLQVVTINCQNSFNNSVITNTICP